VRTAAGFTITSGLLGDSREVDERAEAPLLRDPRACLKAARAIDAAHPGMAETPSGGWRRAAWSYEQSGITRAQLETGVPEQLGEDCRRPRLVGRFRFVP